MDGVNREIEIRFGTKMPVPFNDARTGKVLRLRSFGSATVVVTDSVKYPSPDDVKSAGSMAALAAFEKAVADLSGSLDASELTRSINQIRRKMAENINAFGLQATSVQIVEIVLTPESEEELKRLLFATLTDDHTNSAIQPNPSIHPMTDTFPPAGEPGNKAVMFPKFCTNCGAKAGSRFCPECGAKLV